MVWLVAWTIEAMFPAVDGWPGAADTDVRGFIRQVKTESSWVFWLGNVASAALFMMSPIITVYWPVPAVLLPAETLDRHASRIADHPLYLVRQAMLLLKTTGAMCWGAHPSVRAKWELAPYGPDPGTFRPSESGMSHHAFRERGDDLTLTADYVVVGSGAGGATVANQLARGGASVCVVEAGPWRTPSDYPQTMYGALRDLFDDWGATVTRSRALWPVVQASAVGGTTVINSAIAVPTPPDIFEAWERDHGLVGMSEPMLAHQADLARELHASPTPATTTGRSNELAQLGANKLGYDSHPTTRFVKDCAGSGQCLQACGGERKQSLNLNLIPELLRLGGTLLSCAPVHRVQLDGTRATGVTGRFRHPRTHGKGASFTVTAGKAVVVAASATHSPALLQRSRVRSPALGEQFRAHPGTGIFGIYDDPVDMNTGATQGWASMAYREEPGFKLETLAVPPELVAGRVKGGGRQLVKRLQEYRHYAMWVMAVRAESTGTVRNGWGGKPVVRYLLDEPDMARMRAGAVMVARTHFAAGAKRVVPGVAGLPYEIGRDDLRVLEEATLDPRAWTGILSHLFGGCVMGADPTRSVCDPQGRVHGYDGLMIADASAIPTNLGVNPQLTIMGLARLRADQMLAR